MTTVLLADDEDATLESLVRNIDWQGLHLQLVGCVSNGRDALHYLSSNPPDILVTDIVMPIVTGLELAQYIYENKLPVKVVILSGHQDFQFAQEGMRYNVADYLVKPYRKQQINDTLRELAAECVRRKKELLEKNYFESLLEKSKPQLLEKLLLDLLHGNHISSEALIQKCVFLNLNHKIKYYVIAVEIDNIEENFQLLQEKQKFFAAMHMTEALKATLPNVAEAVILTIQEGQYAILIPDYVQQDIVSTCNTIRETFCSYTNLSATYGIGGPAVELMKLGDAYSKACETLLYKYLAGNNTVICYEDIRRTTSGGKSWVNIMALQTKVIKMVRTGDLESTNALCQEWFSILESCSPQMIKSMIIQFVGNLSLELLEAGASLAELFGEENLIIEKVLRFDTISDIKLWLGQILQFICNYMKEKNQKHTYRLAKKAVQYIDEHYMEDITVDIIASAVSLSSGYLMTIFKKEMSMSIIAYLTMVRMERAKKMLLETDLKIYEIAERVGYSNTTFFSSTFRNHVGMSPKQFKESYRKDDGAPAGEVRP